MSQSKVEAITLLQALRPLFLYVLLSPADRQTDRQGVGIMNGNLQSSLQTIYTLANVEIDRP